MPRMCSQHFQSFSDVRLLEPHWKYVCIGPANDSGSNGRQANNWIYDDTFTCIIPQLNCLPQDIGKGYSIIL